MHAEAATQALVGMNPPDAEDSDDARNLVLRVRSGDTRAFEHLMRRHERLVLGTALRLLGHQEDAQDAAQEVFLRLFKYAGSLDPDKPLLPWLYRVTVNVCRDATERRQATARFIAADEQIEDRGGAVDRSAEDALILGERKRVLRQALAELPDRERLALVLRDIEGLDTHEVAVMLGTSDVTIRTQVCRGRLRLKRFVERMSKRMRT